MSLFLFKSILASILVVLGIVATLTMFSLMGRVERKISAKNLKNIHRIAGFLFFILVLIISYFCIKYWVMIGDQTSIRAALHSVFALGLLILLIIKILIVQFYRQLLKYVPVMGMTIISLAFIVFCTSAGYYFLRTICVGLPAQSEKSSMVESPEPNMNQGSQLYKNLCAACHSIDDKNEKTGPGLKDLFKKAKLPSSGRPATEENVRSQLKTPYLTMPSFKNLSEQDLQDLLAYLKSL
jgi:cytochrome c2